MEERLLKNLKKRYRFVLIVEMILLGLAVLGLFAVLLTYTSVIALVDLKDGVDIKIMLFCAVLLLGMLIAGAFALVPYVKDLNLLRKHEYRLIEATFVRFDYQLSNSEDSRLDAIPLFQDTLTRELMTFSIDEVELGAPERDDLYRIAYLPNSRLAVLEKIR